MAAPAPPSRPPLPWRLGSTAVMSSVGALSRLFLYGFNNIEVSGLRNLLDALDERKGPGGRQRGLLTVCNHVGVLDDPLIWGILPMKYAFNVENLRWSLGSHDICFKNRFSSTFFSLGQVLPTHRLWHSPKGGLYQPTMAQALNLLGSPSFPSSSSSSSLASSSSSLQGTKTSLPTTYSTDGQDSYPAPASYGINRHAWVHVFPEACCHQSPESTLRYFKWGVSRLILESDPAPDFIPMFVHGTQLVMPEDRGWPRWAPRVGNRIRFNIGSRVNVDDLFGRHRAEWKRLVEKQGGDTAKDSPEAQQLRIEVAKVVRDEVSRLREELGLPPDKDDTAALAETWSKEPNKRRFKSPVDGSLINQH